MIAIAGANRAKSCAQPLCTMLERALRRELPGWTLDKSRLSTSMDLERSFSPVYARGLVRKGRSAFAVLGVNRQETQAPVDAALTLVCSGWRHAVSAKPDSCCRGLAALCSAGDFSDAADSAGPSEP